MREMDPLDMVPAYISQTTRYVLKGYRVAMSNNLKKNLEKGSRENSFDCHL